MCALKRSRWTRLRQCSAPSQENDYDRRITRSLMSASPVRHPAVAGRFYPGQRDVLLRDLRTYTGLAAPSRGAGEKGEAEPSEQGTVAEEKIHALGCVVPH